MSKMRLFLLVSIMGTCLVFPVVASAEYFRPYEVQFCTSEDAGGDCDAWTNAYYSSGDFLATFETCKDSFDPCIVWFVCDPYSIYNIHQVALWTYNNHSDVYAHTAAYWDIDSGGLWRYPPGLDHYNYHDYYLYHAWEWSDLSNYSYWDYTPETPVVRQEVCYGEDQEECEENIYAIEVWMGNSTDC